MEQDHVGGWEGGFNDDHKGGFDNHFNLDMNENGMEGLEIN